METGMALLIEVVFFLAVGVIGALLARFFFSVKRDFWKNAGITGLLLLLVAAFFVVAGYGIPYWLGIILLPILSAGLIYLMDKRLPQHMKAGNSPEQVPKEIDELEESNAVSSSVENQPVKSGESRKKDYVFGIGILIALLLLSILIKNNFTFGSVSPEELAGRYKLTEVKGNDQANASFKLLQILGMEIILEIDEDGNGSLGGYGNKSIVDFKFYPEKMLAVQLEDGKETNQGGRFTLKEGELVINGKMFFQKLTPEEELSVPAASAVPEPEPSAAAEEEPEESGAESSF